MKKTLIILLFAGLSILIPLSSQSRGKLSLSQENSFKALKPYTPIAFSQSAEKKYLLKGALSQTPDDAFPYSYYCGGFFNTENNGLPMYTTIYVFSDINNPSNIFAVGYYDNLDNPITVDATGTFNVSTSYADIWIGFTNVWSGVTS